MFRAIEQSSVKRRFMSTTAVKTAKKSQKSKKKRKKCEKT